VLAVQGKMETFLPPLDHPDAGECRVADAPVFHRAYHLAFSASITFFGVYDEKLGHGTFPLNVHYEERICIYFCLKKSSMSSKKFVFTHLEAFCERLELKEMFTMENVVLYFENCTGRIEDSLQQAAGNLRP
jgi:hypothetical protein